MASERERRTSAPSALSENSVELSGLGGGRDRSSSTVETTMDSPLKRGSSTKSLLSRTLSGRLKKSPSVADPRRRLSVNLVQGEGAVQDYSPSTVNRMVTETKSDSLRKALEGTSTFKYTQSVVESVGGKASSAVGTGDGEKEGARKRRSSIGDSMRVAARYLFGASIDDKQRDGWGSVSVATQQKGVIHPYSVFRRYWDVFLTALLLYVALVLPYRVAFQIEPTGFARGFDIFVDSLFILDVFLNACTGFRNKKGHVVMDRKAVALHYFTSVNFLLDLVSAVPLDLILEGVLDEGDSGDTARDTALLRGFKLVRFTKLIRLVKLFRMLRLTHILRRLEAWLSIKYSMLMGIKFFVVLGFTVHWSGCLWYLVATLVSDKPTWVDTDLLGNGELIEKDMAGEAYVASIYWALTTFTTIGFGDIVPMNTEERIFACIAMIVGGGVFAYGLTSLCSILANLNASEVLFRKKCDEINEYMELRHLPQDIRARVRQYMQHWKVSSMLRQHEQELLHEMPKSLRADIAFYVHEGLISKIPFLQNVPNEFIVEVVTSLQYCACGGGELIIVEGSESHHMYIIAHGLVEVVSRTRTVAVLGEGNYFGEISLLFGTLRNTSVRSLCYCEFYTLDYDTLHDLMRTHPEYFRTFRYQAKMRIMNTLIAKMWRTSVIMIICNVWLKDVRKRRSEAGLGPEDPRSLSGQEVPASDGEHSLPYVQRALPSGDRLQLSESAENRRRSNLSRRSSGELQESASKAPAERRERRGSLDEEIKPRSARPRRRSFDEDMAFKNGRGGDTTGGGSVVGAAEVAVLTADLAAVKRSVESVQAELGRVAKAVEGNAGRVEELVASVGRQLAALVPQGDAAEDDGAREPPTI
mmetsp:Transcript_27553/g.94085  ORF Transcript_27553/g.94085 Transcript_27553/m.94085 type:complete len:869 (+) Transcript_27553:197-2803(+)